MKKILILWFGAFIVTFLAGYLNSVTGSDFPFSGTIGSGKKKVTYYFETVYNGKQPMEIMMRTDIPDLEGYIINRTDGAADTIPMVYADNRLTAQFDSVAPGTLLIYDVYINYEGKWIQVPEEMTVTTEILGFLPKTIRILVFVCLFGGVLLAVRSGIDYFTERSNHRKNGFFALIAFSCYSLIVMPVKLSYELGLVNSMQKVSPEIIYTLKDMSFFLVWTAVMITAFNVKNSKLVVAIGAGVIVIMTVFLG